MLTQFEESPGRLLLILSCGMSFNWNKTDGSRKCCKMYHRSDINILCFRGSSAGHGHGAGAAGPYVNYNFRMIDAGSRESLMDLERRRRESATSSVPHTEARETGPHTRGHITRWSVIQGIPGDNQYTYIFTHIRFFAQIKDFKWHGHATLFGFWGYHG